MDHVSVRLGGVEAVRDISLRIGAGELVGLVGANGAGKSTLARAGLGLIARSAGGVSLDGTDPASMSPVRRARLAAWLPQARPLAWPLAVQDVVALGRFCHGAAPGRLGPGDSEAVETALAACSLTALRARSTATLSGGELARVHVARALAAQAPLLVADEPTAALDPAQALAVMQVMADFCGKGGAALVIVHDLALAARFATRVAVMRQGRLIADAPPLEALSPQVLEQAFCIDADMQVAAGAPVLALRGLAR